MINLNRRTLAVHLSSREPPSTNEEALQSLILDDARCFRPRTSRTTGKRHLGTSTSLDLQFLVALHTPTLFLVTHRCCIVIPDPWRIPVYLTRHPSRKQRCNSPRPARRFKFRESYRSVLLSPLTPTDLLSLSNRALKDLRRSRLSEAQSHRRHSPP